MAEIRIQEQTARADGTQGGTYVRETSQGTEPSLGDLFRQLAQDSTTLIRQEVALAKAEMRENVRSAARDAMLVGVGGVITAIGVLVLTAFLVILLGELLANYWLAALVVGLFYLIVGGTLAWTNLKHLRKSELKPEQTIDSLKEDREWLQKEIREARSELT